MNYLISSTGLISLGLWLLSLPVGAAQPCDTASADYTACIAQLYRQPIAQWPAPTVDADIDWQEMAPLPDHAPAPPNNPFTQAKAELGKPFAQEKELEAKAARLAELNAALNIDEKRKEPMEKRPMKDVLKAYQERADAQSQGEKGGTNEWNR